MERCGFKCFSRRMEVSDRRTTEMSNTENIKAIEGGIKMCICCLPADVLLIILRHLSTLDFLSFRSVCRCWRAAFSRCSIPNTDQLSDHFPWVVFLRTYHSHNEDPANLYQSLSSSPSSSSSSKPVPRNFWDPLYEPRRASEFYYSRQLMAYTESEPVLYTTGKIGDSLTHRVYDIPELCGNRLLLSRYGWLLLFSSDSSLFFFNPLCGARIMLPFLDVSHLVRPVFGISAPPISNDCMIFVVSHIKDKRTTNCVKVGLCRRGEATWTTWTPCLRGLDISFINNVVFVKGVFYCLHHCGHFSAFSISNFTWNTQKLLDCGRYLEQPTLVSREVQIGNDTFMSIDCDVPYLWVLVKLQEPFEVTDDWFSYSFSRGVDDAILFWKNKMRFDSFNLDSWYGLCKLTKDNKKFSFCRFFTWPDATERAKESTAIAWLEPQWVEPFLNVRWNSF
ncbi:hypothetical protein HS088_TW11G00827 [Tripterygium wilfordii]|uniref:F-box domain-containing protein n=1 Tax=Tripterygium wilfordii TaxID=458696 RepID=A0A7J7D3C2_TRIWF|nr:uncharacterized protein LOC120008644 [Tripterygium wilfordii]XP_038714961.1 uncharacterized protein LOC120008644 [Tripterygium wilfordii]KAF5740749.1 hypothetical protein HS088_TW11G00827 [Tripterygium wilfordii]